MLADVHDPEIGVPCGLCPAHDAVLQRGPQQLGVQGQQVYPHWITPVFSTMRRWAVLTSIRLSRSTGK